MSDARERIEAWLKAHEKPEIHIDYAKPEAPIPVGASKIGGCPDVPAGFVWPRHKDEFGVDDARKDMERPLSFMAQFDLEQIAAFDTQGLLPKAGHLAFFYDYEGADDGGSLCTEGSVARVFYFPHGTVLERMTLPDDMGENCDIPELALTFSTRTSRPVSNDWPEELLGRNSDGTQSREMALFVTEYEDHGNKAEQGCKLLGHPFTIQNPMEDECQVAFMGVEWDALENPETKAEMEAGMGDWMLLFQFDSIEVEGYADIMFYDSGAMYFWIRKQDLAAGDFSHVYRCIQFC